MPALQALHTQLNKGLTGNRFAEGQKAAVQGMSRQRHESCGHSQTALVGALAVTEVPNTRPTTTNSMAIPKLQSSMPWHSRDQRDPNRGPAICPVRQEAALKPPSTGCSVFRTLSDFFELGGETAGPQHVPAPGCGLCARGSGAAGCQRPRG